MDSNFWYCGTKAVDFRSIPGIIARGLANLAAYDGSLPSQGPRFMMWISEAQIRFAERLVRSTALFRRAHHCRNQRVIASTNHYLRREAGLGGRVRELAILTTARELDSQFEWAAHEPEAIAEGISREIIDISSIAEIRAAWTRPMRSSSSSAVGIVTETGRG
jgi:hypothetical protein